jgi:hypothetical protein
LHQDDRQLSSSYILLRRYLPFMASFRTAVMLPATLTAKVYPSAMSYCSAPCSLKRTGFHHELQPTLKFYSRLVAPLDATQFHPSDIGVPLLAFAFFRDLSNRPGNFLPLLRFDHFRVLLRLNLLSTLRWVNIPLEVLAFLFELPIRLIGTPRLFFSLQVHTDCYQPTETIFSYQP